MVGWIRRGKRAFTLVELLTVIAIVAILSALLFPIFAQSKVAAQKSSTVSNARQTAVAILLYAGDHDDQFPIGQPVSVSTGAILWNYFPAVPANWDNGRVIFDEDDTVVWQNSTHPYRRSYKVLEAVGLPRQRPDNLFDGSFYDKPIGGFIASTNFTMNGLLATLPMSSVAMPSRLTLLWQGEGRVNLHGYGDVKPALRCNAMTLAPCQFNPGGLPQVGAEMRSFNRGDAMFAAHHLAADTAWVLGRGMVFVAVDTSARYVPQNPGAAETPVNSYREPARLYDGNGAMIGFHRCRTSPDAPYYVSFFRPDTEFDYPFGAEAESCRQ